MPPKLTIQEINRRKPSKTRLVAIDFCEPYVRPDGVEKTKVNAICLCGNRIKVNVYSLITGHTISCGCYFMEQAAIRFKRYDHYPFALRRVYMSIKNRCYKENDNCYKSYGLKGVRMCKEWLDDKELFFIWALKNGWEKGLQVDKDIKGNGLLYSPDTCSIVSRAENLANKKNPAIYHDYNGRKMFLPEICKIEGVKYYSVYLRMYRYKDTLIDAIEKAKIIQNKKNIKNETAKHTPASNPGLTI